LLFLKDKGQSLQHFLKLGGEIISFLLEAKITTFKKLKDQNYI